ncbi:response regulator [Aquimarina algicola]|uniref:histidine kinase n=1 Tax=Aquimarina algicola TaxID=2589995 RepID=A0A504J353_9FLAO|nr:response regulator [Aquimarina algicola]TPN85376.1 response regulator [Aquimarina algicola]
MRNILLLFFVIIHITSTAQQNNTPLSVELSVKDSIYSPLSGVLLYKDFSKQLDFKQITLQSFDQIDITELKNSKPNAFYWYKFKIDLKTDSKIIYFFTVISDASDFYIPLKNIGYKKYETGTYVKKGNITYDIEQASSLNLRTDIIDFSKPFYFNKKPISNAGKLSVRNSFGVLITDHKSVVGDIVREQSIVNYLEFYSSAIFVACLLFIVSFFITKDKNFLNYSIYLFFVAGIFAPSTPLIFSLLNSIHPMLAFYIRNLNVIGASFFYFYFIYGILEFKTFHNRLYKIANYFLLSIIFYAVFDLIISIFYPHFDYHIDIFFAFRVYFGSVALLFFIYLFIVRKELISRIILISSFVLIIGNLAAIITGNGLYFLNTVFIEILIFSGIVSYNNKLNNQNRIKNKYDLENERKRKQELIQLDKAKSHFFSNISHELRTPLTLISSPIQNKLEDKNLTDKDRSDFELILNNSNRISELVNQILDISKIEAGSLTLSLQKLHPIQKINAIIKDFEYASSIKNINFLNYLNHHDEEGWFDPDALYKIVSNLISNAIKYTPENGSIIFNANIKESTLFIEIKNTGNGLTKEQLALVFKRFYQAHSEQTGSGIGLALVNELVKLHEGNITVDSKLNEWTSFNLSISLDKNLIKNATIVENNIDDTSLYQTSHKNSNFKTNTSDTDNTNKELPILLIVEDNEDLNHLLQENFKNNYIVISAKDGVEGFKLALQHIPDIIISDIMMPKKDGIELTNELKNDERTSHIPIILLTAKAGEENELSGLQIGVDDYITKPFNQKILTTKVANLIAIRQKLQSRYSQEIVLTPKDIAITPTDENFLNKVQKVLDEYLIESSFSVEEFSRIIGMSRMQLHRKIKALTGLTTSEFVRSQRLKLAAQLLKNSDTNISQVGYAVGFNNHSYFTKCFKETYHCTPTEYATKES